MKKSNKNNVNESLFYDSPDDAVAAINSAYALLQAHGLWGRSIFFLLDFSADEVAPTSNTQGPPLELLNHTYGPSNNTHVTTPWTNLYDMISKCNSTIKNVSAMTNIDSDLKNRVLAEAHFLRGLAYFYINSIYGGGPLRLLDNFDENNTPRASKADIWAQVEKDLTEAAGVLPHKGGYSASDIGRATWGAAMSLLGKAYLYEEKYGEAESTFQQVIGSGDYRLIRASDFGGSDSAAAVMAMRSNHAPDPDYDNNAESVFEVQFKAGTGFGWSTDGTGLNETSIRPQEYGVNGYAFYNAKPSSDLINEYEDNDPRLEAFFFGPRSTFVGEPYPFADDGYAWKKYQKTDGAENSESDVNMDVIRYADVLLMMAEAKIQQGGAQNITEGMDLINQIRRRADPEGTRLPDRPVAVSQVQAMDYLVHERRVELAGEQTRFFDLVRWGLADEEIESFQTGKNEVFPIPQDEINANTAMTEDNQNPGY